MDRKPALIIAILLTLLIAGDFWIFSSKGNGGRENLIVGRVIDGDTLVLEDGRHIRLLNINSPEKDFANSFLATNYVNGFENKTLSFEITGMDKYKRYLARVYSPEYLNLELVKRGFASKFLVEDNELKEFDSAERNAIDRGIGIWKKSIYYGCFEFKIDEKREIVEINNKCSSINVKGWMVKDESRKAYTFGDISLGKIRLHSISGNDNSSDLFWNVGNVWNDDRDSLYLFDDKLEVVGYESYGY